MPIRQDTEGRWHAEACVRRRRLHRRLPTGATARDAKRIEAELIRALHQQTIARQPTIPGDPLLTELMADYTVRHCATLRSPDTARFHAYRIGRWLEGRRASETREVVATIARDLQPVYAAATINRSLAALSKALGDAWQVGRTSTDYSSLVRMLPVNNAKTRYLSMEEVQKLADACSPPVRVAVWIGLLTGCRRGEVLKITPADIGETTIRIQAGNTKTLRYREIPITPALRPWLASIPLAINFEGLKSGIRRAREKVGMPDVGFHTLRHSCATILLQLGTPLHVVRDVLGHSSIRVTERYAHAMVQPQREALEALGRLHRDRTPEGSKRAA